MQKSKLNIPVNKWGTIKSKYKPESKYVSPDDFTAGSNNFVTNISGAIEKRPTDLQYNPASLINIGQDQFESIFANGVHHLLLMDGSDLKYTTGDGIINTATTGFVSTASMEYQMFQNRVYFDNGIDNPSVYDITTNYGGVTYSVPQVKQMGAQPPSSAVTFAADSGTGITGSFHYKVTFLYYGFEESNGSIPSALHTVTNQTINLTNIPIGGYGVTARNIYRDNNDGNYLLVGTISDNMRSSFADATSAGTTPIPVSSNLPPIWRYVALNLSRLFVAGVSGTPTTLYWSDPGLPDIFSPNNFVDCDPGDPVQGIYVYQGIVVVLNRHSIGQITGTTDDTFAYQHIPGSVGCTDNRSIQIRTISGVPILVWLSDRGIYGFNGSSVEYLSDPIEDEVNLNIQQSNFTNGSISQSTQSDWAAGSSTPGIDLASNPGTITTINPTKIFESEIDWESGTLLNIATHDGSNTIKVPTQFSPSITSGLLGGDATIFGSAIQFPTIPSYNQFLVSHLYDHKPIVTGSDETDSYAQSLTLVYASTINDFTVYFQAQGDSSLTYTAYIWADAGGISAGTPGTILWQSSPITIPHTAPFNVSQTFSPSIVLSAGNYFYGFIISTPSGIRYTTLVPVGTITEGSSPYGCFAKLGHAQDNRPTTNWLPALDIISGLQIHAVDWTVNFTQLPISKSGSWQSPIYDSLCDSISPTMVLSLSASYPGSSSGSVLIEGSNDQSSWIVSQTVVKPHGSVPLSTSNARYWRFTYSISTPNNTATPQMLVGTLRFSTVGTWTSPSIETTLDGTSFISMPPVQNTPAGTTALIEIRTSPDGSSWSTYSSIGLANISRCAQIRITLTATSDDRTTPSVSSVQLNWNLASIFTSSIIDLGVVPTGWGVFQDAAALNGGTEIFKLRSASSSGTIPAATFYTVTNGTFPNVAILPRQFTQFQISITSSPNNLPTIDSVTLNYTTGINRSPIRVASLFFNKTYYLAAAELNQTANNVVISYDFEGNWRLFRNISINSLSLFFNAPYYLDANRKYLYQWLIPSTGTSESINMDIRTKAFDGDNVTNLKNIRSLRIMGLNTGTTIHAYYSVDRGTTWIELLNTSGTLGYTTSTDGNKFYEYFVPNYNIGSVVSGTTIMFRVTSVDAFPCTILSMEAMLYIRAGRYIGVPL